MRKLSCMLICKLATTSIPSRSSDDIQGSDLIVMSQQMICSFFNFSPHQGKVQINRIPTRIIEMIRENPTVLDDIKSYGGSGETQNVQSTLCGILNLWSYPEFNAAKGSSVERHVESRNKPHIQISLEKIRPPSRQGSRSKNRPDNDQVFNMRRLSTEEMMMMEDFDDMETDERVNVNSSNMIAMVKLLDRFPDPLTYCIGFIVEGSPHSNVIQIEEEKTQEAVIDATGCPPHNLLMTSSNGSGQVQIAAVKSSESSLSDLTRKHKQAFESEYMETQMQQPSYQLQVPSKTQTKKASKKQSVTYTNFMSDHQIRSELIQSTYEANTRKPLIHEYNSSSKPQVFGPTKVNQQTSKGGNNSQMANGNLSQNSVDRASSNQQLSSDGISKSIDGGGSRLALTLGNRGVFDSIEKRHSQKQSIGGGLTHSGQHQSKGPIYSANKEKRLLAIDVPSSSSQSKKKQPTHYNQSSGLLRAVASANQQDQQEQLRQAQQLVLSTGDIGGSQSISKQALIEQLQQNYASMLNQQQIHNQSVGSHNSLTRKFMAGGFPIQLYSPQNNGTNHFGFKRAGQYDRQMGAGKQLQQKVLKLKITKKPAQKVHDEFHHQQVSQNINIEGQLSVKNSNAQRNQSMFNQYQSRNSDGGGIIKLKSTQVKKSAIIQLSGGMMNEGGGRGTTSSLDSYQTLSSYNIMH